MANAAAPEINAEEPNIAKAVSLIAFIAVLPFFSLPASEIIIR